MALTFYIHNVTLSSIYNGLCPTYLITEQQQGLCCGNVQE